MSSPWIDPSRFLAYWSPQTEEDKGQRFVVNVETGRLERLALSEAEWEDIITSVDGKHALLIDDSTHDTGEFLRISFADLDTGKVEVIYDLNPAAPQWAGPDAHQEDGNSTNADIMAFVEWLDQEHVFLRLEDFSKFRGGWDIWPKLLLVNTTNKQVRVLASKGKIGELETPATGGALVWQTGWVDGELFALPAPFDEQPVKLAGKGLWNLIGPPAPTASVSPGSRQRPRPANRPRIAASLTQSTTTIKLPTLNRS